ncbi:hypothetical protein FOZ63_024910 [Perkinsus olseni]|nr:hypothetical protein FOZ63_024910 [Perkinsus olseni]
MTEGIDTPRHVKPNEEQLVAAARSRLRKSKSLEKCVAEHKAKLVELLGQCVREISERLQRGEPIDPARVDYPLMQAADNVLDLDDLPFRNFAKVDLRTDVVDNVLSNLCDAVLSLCLDTIPVRNVRYHDAVLRQNQALVERMQTVEEALLERSSLLSRCRLAYYRELTHLRNQIYLKRQRQSRGHEDTEDDVYEAYYFDPTDFIEEELRELLNDKIKLSVEFWMTRFNKLKDINAELESIIARDGLREKLKEREEEQEAKRRLTEKKPSVVQVRAELIRALTVEEEVTELCNNFRPEDVLAAFTEVHPGVISQHVQSRIDKEVEFAVAQALEDERRRLEGTVDERVKQERSTWQEKVAELEGKLAFMQREVDGAKQEAQNLQEELKNAKKEEPPPVVVEVAESTEGEEELREAEAKLEAAEERCAALEKSLAEALEGVKSREAALDGLRGEVEKAEAALGEARSREEALQKEVDRLAVAGEESGRDASAVALRELEEAAEKAREMEEVMAELRKQQEATEKERDMLREAMEAEEEAGQRREAALREEMESLRATVATLRDQIQVLERMLADAREAEQAERTEKERRKSGFPDEEFSEADDGSGTAVQTCISGLSDDAGFFMAWTPPDEKDGPVDVFKMELEELDLLARTVWEGYMDVLHAARKPPFGYGDGMTRVHRFTRLVKSVLDRLRRLGELREMVFDLVRSELLRVVAIVRMLQDSSYPDFVSKQGRSLLFGKGMSSVSRVTEATSLVALLRVEGSIKGNLENLYVDLMKAGSVCPMVELDFRPGRRLYIPARATVRSALKYAAPEGPRRPSTSQPLLPQSLDTAESVPVLEAEEPEKIEFERLPSVLPRPREEHHQKGLSPSVMACFPQQNETLSPSQGKRRRPKSGGGLYVRRPDEPAGTRPGTTTGAIRRSGSPETVVRVLRKGRGEQQSKSTPALDQLEGSSANELRREASYFYLCRTAGPGVLKTPFTASGPLRKRREPGGDGEFRTASSASVLRRRLDGPQRVGRSPTAAGWTDGVSHFVAFRFLTFLLFAAEL